VLTCPGRSFAARVAASLLRAVDLPELIAPTSEAYEDLAVALATDAGRLTQIREKLAHNRLTTPLFNTPRFTRHMEAAYTQMYARHCDGLAPDHLVVSAQ
jgi:protein O-GlcNAc transferase